MISFVILVRSIDYNGEFFLTKPGDSHFVGYIIKATNIVF